MNPDPIVEPDKPIGSRNDWLTRYSRAMARIVPDAISTVAIMIVILFALSLALGNSTSATFDAWYRGLWMLLPFTMQMTLILLLGCVLAATPCFASLSCRYPKLPRTSTQVIIASVLCVAAISYLNWGLALALGPIIAVHFAGEAERRGIPIDFPFLLAVNGGAGSVWQFGLSASGPLMMATPGHFLEGSTGTMSLLSTIWSPASLALVTTFPIAVILVARSLMPKQAQQLSDFPSASKLAEPLQPSNQAKPPSRSRIEHHWLIAAVLCLGMLAWLYYHFLVKRSSLDLNSLNTIFLMLCFLLHGNIRNLSRALQRAVVSCWPILVLYHLYAGVAGLIQFTTIGAAASDLVSSHLDTLDLSSSHGAGGNNSRHVRSLQRRAMGYSGICYDQGCGSCGSDGSARDAGSWSG